MAIKPTDQEILALYQEAGPSGPSDELDRNILTAARAVVKSDSTPAPWWPRWRLPLQAVATICLFAMVSIMLEHREPMTPAIPPLAMNDSGPATDQQPPPPQYRALLPSLLSRGFEWPIRRQSKCAPKPGWQPRPHPPILQPAAKLFFHLRQPGAPSLPNRRLRCPWPRRKRWQSPARRLLQGLQPIRPGRQRTGWIRFRH